jgi:hypothetical protein
MDSTRQAQRENLKMKMSSPPQQVPQMPGMPPQPPSPPPVQVNLFDDHIEHINTHSIFMRTQQYEQLDPQIQSIFMQHLQQHVATLQSGQGIDQQLQQPPQPQLPPGQPSIPQSAQPQPQGQTQGI